jgi:hypothetical protein
MSLLRVFDVTCWMLSWKDEDGASSQEALVIAWLLLAG